MLKKIILTVYTDPMMGLSYESEPIMDRLKRDYAGQIEFRYVMSLLVRDVSDFMTPQERAMEPEEGIRRYCRRLAEIYKSEESIGGLPIHMDGFRLFDAEHRSSKPLDLAFEAAKLTDPEKAERFLTALRHATVRDCRPTTHFEEIMKVVRAFRLDEAAFVRHYQDGTAQTALYMDLELTRSCGVRSLPAYMFQYGGRTLLMQSFDYHDFAQAIAAIRQEKAVHGPGAAVMR